MSVTIFMHLREAECQVRSHDDGYEPYVVVKDDDASIFVYPESLPALEQAIAEVRKIEESRERIERARQLVNTPGVVDDDSAMLYEAMERASEAARS